MYGDPHESLMRTKRAIQELVDIEFILLYRIKNQTYFHIRNWEKHQKVQHPGKPIVPGLEQASCDPHETLTPDLRILGSKDQEGRGSISLSPIQENSPEESKGGNGKDPNNTPHTLQWTDVYKVLQGLTGFASDAHYHKAHLESIARQCNQQSDPLAALTTIIKRKKAQVEKSGKRVQPIWLATDFDLLLNVKPAKISLDNDETYQDLIRQKVKAEQDVKLEKSIGTQKRLARAEKVYSDLQQKIAEYRQQAGVS
jgi:hypothetical protein